MTREVKICIHKIEAGVVTLTITASNTDPRTLRIVWYRDGAKVGLTGGWTFEAREAGTYTAELLTPDGAATMAEGKIVVRPEWFEEVLG